LHSQIKSEAGGDDQDGHSKEELEPKIALFSLFHRSTGEWRSFQLIPVVNWLSLWLKGAGPTKEMDT
jgi:hypothetical protein